MIYLCNMSVYQKPSTKGFYNTKENLIDSHSKGYTPPCEVFQISLNTIKYILKLSNRLYCLSHLSWLEYYNFNKISSMLVKLLWSKNLVQKSY